MLESFDLLLVGPLRLAGLFGHLGELGVRFTDGFSELGGFFSDLVVLPLADDELLVELCDV